MALSNALIHSYRVVLSWGLIHSRDVVLSWGMIHSQLMVPSLLVIKTGPLFYAHALHERTHKVPVRACHDDVRTMLRASD